MPSRRMSVDAVGDVVLNTEIMTERLKRASIPCRPFWSYILPQDSYLSLKLTQLPNRDSRDLLVELSPQDRSAFARYLDKGADMN